MNRLLLISTLVFAICTAGCKALSGESDVEYRVTGPSTTRVSLTYESQSGTSQISSAALPWSYTRTAKKSDFLCVSAQIIQGGGTITASIYEDDNLLYTATATGFPSIATASGTLP